MADHVLSSDNIVHIGAILYLAGFLFRNQIILRTLIIAGDIVYILYFYFAPEVPLWGGIFWSTMFMLVNAAMVTAILSDRMHFRLSRTEKRLFELLKEMTPGQFRKLLAASREQIAVSHLAITIEDKPLDELYFVLERNIEIEKKGTSAVIPSDTFIGEIAFLLSQPASATVTIEPGTPYFVWNAKDLKQLMQSKPDLGTALNLALNRKMAQKIAASGFLGEVSKAAASTAQPQEFVRS
jgi:hypothetical protein